MIIDSHVHICESPNDDTQLQRVNLDGTTVRWSGTRADAALDNLLRAMDENEIDKALIMGLEGIVSNRSLGEITNQSSRLEGFAWVTDPKKPESVEELETAIREYGLIGLKLHPSLHSFVPSDPAITPLIEKTVELNIPTLIHSYPWPPGYYFNNLPYHIDLLKRRVPEAVILFGHMGHLNYNDLLVIARQSGVYAESSWGLTLMAELNGHDYAVKYLRRIGVENVVYGSDWFGPNGEMERQLELIEKLDLTREERDEILDGNISQILDL